MYKLLTQLSQQQNMFRTLKNTTKTTYTIKSLKSKKKCYVKVRAYKVVKGKKIYGSYSKVLKVTVK